MNRESSTAFLFCLMAVFWGTYSEEICTSDHFLCEEDGSCIAWAQACDGNDDCINGTDEANCNSTDCQGFECPGSTMCIPSDWICDGDNDCGDSSDEENCPERTTTECSAFQCSDGSCIPNEWKCDAEVDCDDGEDEEGCACNGFQCPSGRCIPSGWTCDGDNDCGDSSDENEAACPCQSEEHRCPTSATGTPGACIPPEWMCDSDEICDCSDCSDQTNCTESTESSGAQRSRIFSVKGQGRRQRPSSVKAANTRRITKANEKKAMEQRHAAKQHSSYFNNKTKK